MKNLTRADMIKRLLRKLDLVHDAEQLMELEAELFQMRMRHYLAIGDNMTEYRTIQRQGHTVLIKQLPDDRLVLVSQDGYIERREIINVPNK